VGDVEVPAAAFHEIYDLKLKKYTERGKEVPVSADRRYRKSIVERLIWNEILRQEAAKLGVVSDEAALTARVEREKQGVQDWAQHLDRRGETEASLVAMYRAEALEQAILDKQGKLTVTPEEIQAEYEKVKSQYKSDKPRIRASHILVPVGSAQKQRPKPGETPPQPTPEEQKAQDDEARAKADEIYKKVTAAGADFAAIAEAESVGPNAGKGGDLGIFTEDRMVEEFSAVAFKMAPGQISKPVKTKFGYHVIKVVGKWGPGELPMAALEDQLRDRMEQRKLHQGKRELKDALKAAYQVVDHVGAALGPEPERPAPSRPARPVIGADGAPPEGAGAAAEGTPPAQAGAAPPSPSPAPAGPPPS
jgi:peptidyl-prolyl cis-trans isomerase C